MPFTIYAVKADSTIIQSINGQGVEKGAEVRGEALSGQVFRSVLSLVGQKPSANFTTLAIAQALAALPPTGKNIADLTLGLTLYGQKASDGGSRASGSVHMSYVFAKGIIVGGSLTCDHQGDAQMAYNVHTSWDGTNAPLIQSHAAALPAGLADSQRFTIGPVTFGSYLIDEVKNISIDWVNSVKTEGYNSELYDRTAYIETTYPMITIRTTKLDVFRTSGAIPILGLAGTHATTAIYLRKRDATGVGFVADATAEHVKLTACGVAHVTTAMGGTSPAEATIQIPLRWDGTNYPILITTASAIS